LPSSRNRSVIVMPGRLSGLAIVAGAPHMPRKYVRK
jgi:hypothetical protein